MMKRARAAVSQQLHKQIHTVSAHTVASFNKGRALLRWDRETIARTFLPFLILLLYLIGGMLVFYMFESPAESQRQRIAVRKNLKALWASGDIAKFGSSVSFETFIIELTPPSLNNASLSLIAATADNSSASNGRKAKRETTDQQPSKDEVTTTLAAVAVSDKETGTTTPTGEGAVTMAVESRAPSITSEIQTTLGVITENSETTTEAAQVDTPAAAIIAISSSDDEGATTATSEQTNNGTATAAVDLKALSLNETAEMNNFTTTTPETALAANSPTELLDFLNKKFFLESENITIFAFKVNKSVTQSGSQMVALTVFYSNEVDSERKVPPPTEVENLKWDLPGSLFFCLAVVTTIGYGNTAPATNIGKCLCVVYAFFGIPLFQLVVEEMRTVLISFACRLHGWLYRLARSCARQSSKIIQRSATELKKRRIPVPIFLNADRGEVRAATGFVAIIGCCTFIFLPSILFVNVEGWDYLSSLYFCFISLTTIGFGDLIAGQQSGGSNADNEFAYGCYRVIICTWLFFGIAFIATLVHIMETLLERLIMRIKFFRNKNNRDGGDSSGLDEAENTVNLLDIIDNSIFSENERRLKSRSSTTIDRMNHLKPEDAVARSIEAVNRPPPPPAPSIPRRSSLLVP